CATTRLVLPPAESFVEYERNDHDTPYWRHREYAMTSLQRDVVDLLILGSGSTAFAAVLHARELGKTAVMTENRTLGGTCVNRGCLPSKNLIEAARLVHDAAHPRYPGLTPAHL